MRTDTDTTSLLEPGGVSRRRFIQGAAAGVGGLAMTPWLETLMAHAAPPLDGNDGILVLLELEGGNDGLNMLPPVGLGGYYDKRPTLAIPENQALDLKNKMNGLHPAMPKLRRRYERGKVAFVRGVGYVPPDFSHFTSMALVMQGWGGSGIGSPTGWAGRYIDGLKNSTKESLYGVTMGWRVPLALTGRNARPAALPGWINGAFGVDRSQKATDRLVKHVMAFGEQATGLGRWGDSIAKTNSDVLKLATRITPAYNETGLPDGDHWLSRQLVLAARLINLNLGIRVVHVSIGGFDTHANQASDHAELLGEVDAGIEAFYNALGKSWRDQTLMLLFSEFGRRPEENGDAGTDHGSSGPFVVIGDAVKGGFYGAQPRLADSSLKWWGNMDVEVDYRQIYAEVLRKWMRADAKEILGRKYDHLGLLRYSL